MHMNQRANTFLRLPEELATPIVTTNESYLIEIVATLPDPKATHKQFESHNQREFSHENTRDTSRPKHDTHPQFKNHYTYPQFEIHQKPLCDR